MTWDQWSEDLEEACPVCHGVGIFDSGDRGHGACEFCRGTGVDPGEGAPSPDSEAGDPEDPAGDQ